MKWSIIYWITLFTTGPIIFLVTPMFHQSIWWFLFLTFFYPSLIRRIIFKHVPSKLHFTKQETAIITGAGSGIGSKVATNLAARGAKVIWAARDDSKCQRIVNDLAWTDKHGPRGYVLQMDLASKKSIEQFVSNFRKRESKLNIIILNAAYHGPRRITEDGFESTMGVNHLGHMYLTYLLLDMLVESGPSRIVVVASDLHHTAKRVHFEDIMYEKNYAPWTAYNHSKLLNILFVRALSKRLKGTNVTVHAAHPGTPVPGTDLVRDHWLGSAVFRHFIFPFFGYLYARSLDEAAQTPLYCSLSEECGKSTGAYYENCRTATPSRAAMVNDSAEKLWNMSCDLLKIDRNWIQAHKRIE